MSGWQSVDVLFGQEYEPTVDLHDDRPARRLPFPPWHQEAACLGREESVFFGARDTSMRPALSMSDVNRAKAICASCPVFDTCLEQALGVNGPREEYGIWAGTSGRTRKRIWEMVEAGKVTLTQVVKDVMDGLGAKYESKIVLTPVSAPMAIRQQAS